MTELLGDARGVAGGGSADASLAALRERDALLGASGWSGPAARASAPVWIDAGALLVALDDGGDRPRCRRGAPARGRLASRRSGAANGRIVAGVRRDLADRAYCAASAGARRGEAPGSCPRTSTRTPEAGAPRMATDGGRTASRGRAGSARRCRTSSSPRWRGEAPASQRPWWPLRAYGEPAWASAPPPQRSRAPEWQPACGEHAWSWASVPLRPARDSGSAGGDSGASGVAVASAGASAAAAGVRRARVRVGLACGSSSTPGDSVSGSATTVLAPRARAPRLRRLGGWRLAVGGRGDLRRADDRLGRACLAPAGLAAPAALGLAAALREVAQQLARQRGRLARHPRARAVDDLAGLGGVRERGGQQRGRQPAVLLARRVHQPARVARVGAAGGVHEQAEQPLGLGPALDRVLLVDLARHVSRSARSSCWPGRGGRSSSRPAPAARP